MNEPLLNFFGLKARYKQV